MQETLAISDVMKLNEEELFIVTELCGVQGTEDEMLLSFLQNFGLEMIALTKGGDGSRLFSLSHDSVIKAPHVDVVDTVGAGDAFTAALVMGLLSDHSIEKTHQNATKLSAYVCTQKGATPRIPEKLISEMLEP